MADQDNINFETADAKNGGDEPPVPGEKINQRRNDDDERWEFDGYHAGSVTFVTQAGHFWRQWHSHYLIYISTFPFTSNCTLTPALFRCFFRLIFLYYQILLGKCAIASFEHIRWYLSVCLSGKYSLITKVGRQLSVSRSYSFWNCIWAQLMWISSQVCIVTIFIAGQEVNWNRVYQIKIQINIIHACAIPYLIMQLSITRMRNSASSECKWKVFWQQKHFRWFLSYLRSIHL